MTGVEFVHMFSSLGSKVTLVVSRQQVLPQKDPEVAAVLEDDFLRRGVKLLKGARAESIVREGDEVVVSCDDGRVVRASHAVLAIGSIPNTEGLGLEEAGVKLDGGYVVVNHHCQSSVRHIYAAGDVSGKLPLSSVASSQGREVAKHAMGLHTMQHRHLDYDKAASAIFTEPEIADVGLAEAEAFASGRKIRVTKVPFSSSAKALINNDSRGFIKILSDPLTGVVLGGSIVGRHAAELISVVALAVTAGLKVSDIAESLLVHRRCPRRSPKQPSSGTGRFRPPHRTRYRVAGPVGRLAKTPRPSSRPTREMGVEASRPWTATLPLLAPGRGQATGRRALHRMGWSRTRVRGCTPSACGVGGFPWRVWCLADGVVPSVRHQPDPSARSARRSSGVPFAVPAG